MPKLPRPLSLPTAPARAGTAWLVLAALALPGCATLSEAECKTADWFRIGERDGRDGYPRARLHKHREACIEYGIRPDAETYYAGRQIGLARYCTPSNGFREGREGRPYRDVCPAKHEPGFLAEYRKGEAIHEVEEEIEDVEDNIDRKENRLDDDDTSAAQADALREDLRDLYRELRYLSRDLLRLERQYGGETL